MTTLLDITIWLHTQSEANARDHWRTVHARRKKQRKIVANVLACYPRERAKIRAGMPARITLTRIAPRPIKDTHDNYATSLKAIVDEIAAWLGVDDGGEQVTWRYGEQKRGRVREYAVRIEVER